MEENTPTLFTQLNKADLLNILSNTPTGVAIIQNGKICFCNSHYASIGGYEVSDLLHKPLINIIHKKDRKLLGLVLAKDFPEIRNNRRNSLTYRILDKEGNMKWIKSHITIIEWGGEIALLDSAIDFTQQKQNEALVLEEEKNFRLLYNSIDDLILIVNSSLHIIQTNNATLRVLGYKEHEILFKTLNEIHTNDIVGLAEDLFGNPKLPDNRAIVTDVYKSNGEALVTETSIMRGTWSERPVLFLFSHNITDKINAEKAIKASEEKFHKAFETSPISMAINTIDGGIFLDVNNSFIRTFGFKRKGDVVGKTIAEINFYVEPADGDKIREELSIVSRLENKEILLRKANGDIVTGLYSGEIINILGEDCIISAINDITDRKKVENTLQERTAQLSSILNNLPFLAWIKNNDGQFLAVNDAFANHYHQPIEKVIGHTDFQFWPYEKALSFKESDELVIQTKQKLFFETSEEINGKIVHWETFKSPVLNLEGRVIATTGITRDITEQKEYQIEREKNLMWQEFLTEFSFTLAITPSYEKILEKQFAKIGKMLSLSRVFYLGIEDNQFAHLEYEWCAPSTISRKDIVKNIDLGKLTDYNIELQVGEIISIENVATQLPKSWQGMLTARGSKSVLVAPIFQNNELIGVVCFEETRTFRSWKRFEIEGIKTITNLLSSAIERKQAEALLSKSEKKFREFAEQLPESVFETDLAGAITYANDLLYAQFNLKKSQTPIFLKRLLCASDADNFDKLFRDATKKHESPIGEFMAKQGLHNEFPVLLHLSPIVEDDKCIGTRGLLIDISERKKQEMELVAAKESAERASKAKEEFLSVMSHEIRTPLNAVIGLANLMLQEEPRFDQKENLDTLLSSAQSLLTLINDILDFSKIEAGKIAIEQRPVNLRNFAQSIAKTFEISVTNKGLKFITKIDKKLPETLVTDPFRINQIITNLVGNAIKFTPSGSISLKIKQKETRQNEVLIRFEIVDTGIGIEKEKQTEIFKEFTQADAAITRKYGGTGLGLAISKKLVNLLGGDLNIKSTPDVGSVFYFDIWMLVHQEVEQKNDAAKEVVEDDAIEPLKGFKILVVEDNEINKLITQKFLTKWGAEFFHAENGQVAVDMTKDQDFNCILMDIEMPVMGGYEATENIRKLNRPLAHQVPIVALTASALPDIQHRITKAGMNDFLLKPFNPKDLRQKLLLWLKK